MPSWRILFGAAGAEMSRIPRIRAVILLPTRVKFCTTSSSHGLSIYISEGSISASSARASGGTCVSTGRWGMRSRIKIHVRVGALTM